MESAFRPLKYGVGIDMGKTSFYVCLSGIDAAGRIKIKATHSFANTPKGFAEFDRWCEHHLKDKHIPLHFLMEATGVYYEQLALWLHKRGALVSVVLPQKAKYYLRALGLKTKTDGVDAQGLATMVCQQRLDTWRPISQAMYELRQLTRQHTDLQVFKTKISNHLLSLEQGMYYSKAVHKQMVKLIEEIEDQLADCEKLIAKAIAANAEWKRKVEQICVIKGVGLLTIAHLITETNEFALFENQRQLVSYAGYDVVENQSGNRVGKTRISKRGNARIRHCLHMASLMVVRYEQRPFVGLYERVFERTKIKMKGYVAVQRKLLTLIYALWKKDELYRGDYGSEPLKKVAPSEGATQHRPQADVLEKANMVELVES